jgi:hypothetical protein
VQSSNCLPEGGSLSAGDLAPVAHELRRALDWAAATPEILIRRDAAAPDLWADRYPALSQLRPGLRGAATSRAEALVLRLSAIDAALDSTSVIGLPHLQAALAVWDYCYASASRLFGMSTGDPIADRIREASRPPDYRSLRSGASFMVTSRATASTLPSKHSLPSGALTLHSERTGGRPSTHWSAIEKDEHEENEESVAEDQAPAEDQ